MDNEELTKSITRLLAAIDEALEAIALIRGQIELLLHLDIAKRLSEMPVDPSKASRRPKQREIISYLAELRKIKHRVNGVEEECFSRTDAVNLLRQYGIMISPSSVERGLEMLIRAAILEAFKPAREIMYRVIRP